MFTEAIFPPRRVVPSRVERAEHLALLQPIRHRVDKLRLVELSAR